MHNEGNQLKTGTFGLKYVAIPLKWFGTPIIFYHLVFPDRVLYARKAGEDVAGTSVDSGEKITLEIASVRSISLNPGAAIQNLRNANFAGFERVSMGLSQYATKVRMVESWINFPSSWGPFCIWVQDTEKWDKKLPSLCPSLSVEAFTVWKEGSYKLTKVWRFDVIYYPVW